MQANYPPDFTREHGSTEAEWLQRLPGAVEPHRLTMHPGQAEVVIGSARLQLAWQALPPRRIALIAMPRLQVHYRFSGLDEATRHTFMRRFDLYIQRGGG